MRFCGESFEKSHGFDFATQNLSGSVRSIPAPTAITLAYNGEAQALVNAGSTDFGMMLYSLTEEGEFTATIPTGTNAGGYVVYYRVQGNENVNDSAVASVTVEIAQAEVSITAAPTPNTLTYTGVEQNLISQGEAVGGTMVYSLTENDGYTTNIPQGTNAGDYTVWYYVQGDANHNDSAKAIVSVNIVKAPVTITLDPKTKEYGDGERFYSYTVEGLIGDDTLQASITRESIEVVGVHPYKLNMSYNPGDENYTINYVGASITIVPKELNMEDLYIEMDPESFVYDGTEKKPVSLSIYDLRVSYVEQKLVEGKDYEVTGYHNNVNPGTATVTIQGIGNFTGPLTITFSITPAHQILGEQ